MRLLPALLLPLVVLSSDAAAGPTSHACAVAPQTRFISPEGHQKLREIRSDSLWLIRRLRRRYPDRLAAAYVEPVSTPDARLVVRVTGRAPLPPMRLGGRHRVPVVVQYGAPFSLRQVEAIRMDPRVQAAVRRLVPELQGVAYDETEGVIRLDVYVPDEPARRRALAQCGALREVYGMPVRIETLAARVSDQ